MLAGTTQLQGCSTDLWPLCGGLGGWVTLWGGLPSQIWVVNTCDANNLQFQKPHCHACFKFIYSLQCAARPEWHNQLFLVLYQTRGRHTFSLPPPLKIVLMLSVQGQITPAGQQVLGDVLRHLTEAILSEYKVQLIKWLWRISANEKCFYKTKFRSRTSWYFLHLTLMVAASYISLALFNLTRYKFVCIKLYWVIFTQLIWQGVFIGRRHLIGTQQHQKERLIFPHRHHVNAWKSKQAGLCCYAKPEGK